MRCKACNKPLQDYEIMSKNTTSCKHEEMCRMCINESCGHVFGPEVKIVMDVPLLDCLPNGPKSMDN